VGANKLMHAVLADDCTGCDLCVAPCPVDCISMIESGQDWTTERANTARTRYQQRQRRLETLHHESSSLAARTLANKAPVAAQASSDAATRQQVIADALARARARRQNK